MSDQQQKSTSMAPGAMASLILGIIGWCTSYIVVGIVLCAIGIAMGGKAKKAIAANPTGYRAAGVAKAGHIISIIGLIASIIFSIIFIAAFVASAALNSTANSMWTQ
jgi:hypothetical protein